MTSQPPKNTTAITQHKIGGPDRTAELGCGFKIKSPKLPLIVVTDLHRGPLCCIFTYHGWPTNVETLRVIGWRLLASRRRVLSALRMNYTKGRMSETANKPQRAGVPASISNYASIEKPNESTTYHWRRYIDRCFSKVFQENSETMGGPLFPEDKTLCNKVSESQKYTA